MATFVEAPPEVLAMLAELMQRSHRDLHQADVTFNVLMASPTGGSPAISSGGYPAVYSVKVCSLEERAAGASDVRIKLDASAWRDYGEDERRATLDGVLYGLEVIKRESGVVKEDNLGRPRLRVRKFDVVVKGHTEIVKRHGLAAPEAKAFVAAQQKWQQGSLWG